MPSHYTIDVNKKIIYVVFKGILSQSIIVSCLKNITDDPLYESSMGKLVDLRRAKVHSSFNIEQLTEVMLSVRQEKTKMAIVSEDAVTLAKSMIFLSSREGYNKVFSGYQNAEAWLLG